MSIPRWIIFLVALWVLLWGGYRIYLGIANKKSEADDPDRPTFRRKGLFGRSRRSHFVYGVLYLILGSYLVAMGFGYYFTIGDAGCAGEVEGSQPAPAADEEPPMSGAVEVK